MVVGDSTRVHVKKPTITIKYELLLRTDSTFKRYLNRVYMTLTFHFPGPRVLVHHTHGTNFAGVFLLYSSHWALYYRSNHQIRHSIHQEQDQMTHPPRAILVQHRNSAPDEVERQPARHKSREHTAPAGKRETRTPKGVAKVVHVAGEREKAASIDFTRVLRPLLERRTLNL
jgi:hypothetical protein